MTRPACAGHPDPDLFHDATREAEAKDVCAGCPVAAACFTGAVERDEPCGVWGGVTFGPDLGMVVAEPRAHLRPTVRAHGHRGTYNAGCRCDPCTAANNTYQAGYRDHGPAVTRPEIVDLQISLFEGVA